jgi:hypothetical protein
MLIIVYGGADNNENMDFVNYLVNKQIYYNINGRDVTKYNDENLSEFNKGEYFSHNSTKTIIIECSNLVEFLSEKSNRFVIEGATNFIIVANTLCDVHAELREHSTTFYLGDDIEGEINKHCYLGINKTGRNFYLVNKKDDKLFFTQDIFVV